MAARTERGMGIPLTEEERRARHLEIYGTEEVPTRGTGLIGGNPNGNPNGNSIPWGWLLVIGIALLILRRR